MPLPSVLPHSMGFRHQPVPAGRTERGPQQERQEEQVFYPESALHRQYQHYSHFSFRVLHPLPQQNQRLQWEGKYIPHHMFCDNILGPLIAPCKYFTKIHLMHTVGTHSLYTVGPLIHKQTPHPPKWICDSKVQFQINHLASPCSRSTWIFLNGHSTLPPDYPSWDQLQNRINFPDHLKNATVWGQNSSPISAKLLYSWDAPPLRAAKEVVHLHSCVQSYYEMARAFLWMEYQNSELQTSGSTVMDQKTKSKSRHEVTVAKVPWSTWGQVPPSVVSCPIAPLKAQQEHLSWAAAYDSLWSCSHTYPSMRKALLTYRFRRTSINCV